jgi:DNA transformation protein
MPNTPSFVEHALELVSLVGPARARRMFGGHGLYLGDVMFGLLDDDELFLKTDAETVARFEEAHCEAWVYAAPRGPQRTSYYRPPDEAHEDPEAMLPWARLAVDAALRAAAVRVAKAAARAPGSGRPAKVAAGAPRRDRPAKAAARAPGRSRPAKAAAGSARGRGGGNAAAARPGKTRAAAGAARAGGGSRKGGKTGEPRPPPRRRRR